jgi:hypothetical protein
VLGRNWDTTVGMTTRLTLVPTANLFPCYFAEPIDLLSSRPENKYGLERRHAIFQSRWVEKHLSGDVQICLIVISLTCWMVVLGKGAFAALTPETKRRN